MEKDLDKFSKFKSQVSTELDLEILKLYLEKKSQRRLFFGSPVFTLVASAIFGLIGTGLGAWLQGRANLELEQKKFESSLIINMLDTKTQADAALNLQFLVKAGLIRDKEGLISQLSSKPKSLPIIGKGRLSTSEIKQMLNDLSYYNGKIDNIYDDSLKHAVFEFQVRNKLSIADGLVGAETQRALIELYYKE
ncbi:MAG: peptidoglycan-binding domain-containing protein [Bacteroidota bacterium]